MRYRTLPILFIVTLIVAVLLKPHQLVHAKGVLPAPAATVSAYELIIAMNTLRVSSGLPALIEDPIVNAVAQTTAEIMAANQMSWHIGDVRGRLASAGYGGGSVVWATENFAVSGGGMGLDEIMAVWADPDHMRPAVEAAYCHIGAGVATANGKTYYVLQAAYISGQACGSYSPGPGSNPQSGAGSGASTGFGLIVPVIVATPDAEGKVYHVVQTGQSFWSIAIAYKITIQDLETWNNLSRTTPLRAGQRLFIPGKDTVGYATPTPKGMIIPSTPDVEGRIFHEVQPYQALITIADAYGVTVDRLLALNGLQLDWPLQIGQRLLISPGNVTPSPTLSPIQRLTPEVDGNYYHTIQSGQTLSWIASLYNIPLADLMRWNGLNDASIIRPEQKILLMVTPPATPTSTPSPTVAITPTLTITPTPMSAAPTAQATPSIATDGNAALSLPILAALAAVVGGGLLWWGSARRVSNG